MLTVYNYLNLIYCDPQLLAPVVVPENNDILIEETTSSSLAVSWQTLNVSDDVATYYGYLVQARENDSMKCTVDERVLHNGFDGSYDIQDLLLNTEYIIHVTPYRFWENITDFGTPYTQIQLKTNCSSMYVQTLKMLRRRECTINILKKKYVCATLPVHCGVQLNINDRASQRTITVVRSLNLHQWKTLLLVPNMTYRVYQNKCHTFTYPAVVSI